MAKGRKMRRWCIGMMAACLLTVPGSVFCGGGPQADQASPLMPRRVSWEHLRYEARSWTVELTVDLRLSQVPSHQVETDLMDIEGAPLKASGGQTSRLTMEMRMSPALGSRVDVDNTVWFNPGDAAALGRYRVRRGEDEFEKTYRFARQGVFRHNREPQNKTERRLEPDAWSRQVDSFYPYDPVQLGCPVVSDRLLLVYIVSALDPKETDPPPAFCVFGKRQLHRVTLRPDGRETIAVDYSATSPASQTPHRETVDAFRIRLETEPLASSLDEPENFSFLGMHRDIVFFVDPRTHLPLQISGRIGKVGAGNLILREVRLKRQ